MTTNQKIVVAIILGILVLSLGIRKVLYDKHQAEAHQALDQQEARIDSLQNLLDSNVVANEILQEQFTTLQLSMQNMRTEIEQDKQTLIKLKTKRNEKTAAVSKYSSDDIIRFLSTRYKSDSTDSTSTK